MSKAAYWQRGEAIDYINDTNDIVEANTVLPLAERISIAGADIKPKEKGSLHVCGVFEFAKTSNDEILPGTSVFFDGTGITETAGGTPAGFVTERSAAGAKTILVKIG